MSIKSRLQKLEQRTPQTDRPAWVELLDGDRVILRMADGRRIEATRADIPQGVKVYGDGASPDDWFAVKP